MHLDFERCYRAVESRDSRFDGWFVTAVTSTHIYCRPSCPALTPKRQNVRFLPSAAAAQREGFRACLRCRPDAAPGSPEWDIRADVVGRAMRLIADGIVDRDGVPGLAGRLGYTVRHLHRMLTAELGAGPLALARAQRAQTARILIETTDLGLADVAFAAGFGSVRQFNDTIREIYGRIPSELRTARRGVSLDRPSPAAGLGTINLRLPYREPLFAPALLEFLDGRTVPGVDEVCDGAYHRVLRLPYGTGTAVLTPMPGYVSATLRLRDVRDLAPAVARCRRLFDLDADPAAVDAVLGADPALTATVTKEPGVRVPRSVDGFEMAVRAIVGQQISVVGARKILTKLAQAATGPDEPASILKLGTRHAVETEPKFMIDGEAVDGEAVDGEAIDGEAIDGEAVDGELDGAATGAGFPTAEELAEAPDDAFAMPVARRETLRTLARAVAEGELRLDPGADRTETEKRLLRIHGIGAWTAQYVAIRALGDPDTAMPGDLGVRRGAAALGLTDNPAALAAHAQRTWAPWRSYATVRLWRHA
jgi:AraC family transcriptional regulator of adaptative response / DNA-3-methyladenine glycosylase II